MQYSSKDVSLLAEFKTLPKDFSASCQEYIQIYRPDNELHYHNCLEIGLCLEGSGTQMIANQIYAVKKDSIFVIPANCIHDSHIPMKINEKGSVWQYIFVDLEKIGVTYENFVGFSVDDSELVPLFHLMYHELEQKPHNYQSAFLSLLSCFLIYAKRIAPSNLNLDSQELPSELTHALHSIHSSYDQPFSISKLAKECNVSSSSLNRMFQAHFNASPLTYLHRVRLAAAEHMIKNTNVPILTISSSVGFTSLSSFNRAFKKRYNMSPRDMRQKAIPKA